MGQAASCISGFESGAWDQHPNVHQEYPDSAAAGQQPGQHHHHHHRHLHHRRGGDAKAAGAQQPCCGPQDMTRPLPEYFVSSGHNSYLEGNQLTSKAGAATIEASLRLGCRVIELDVYDGPKGEPVVTHGGTLTSTASFRELVAAVARSGFVASPYPVILTIENHCGKEQQAAMARDLRSALGARLHEPDPQQLNRDGRFLSPEALKGKVVVRMKVKPDGSGDEGLTSLVYVKNAKLAAYDLDGAAAPAAPVSHSVPDSKLPKIAEYAAAAAAAAASASSSTSSSSAGGGAGGGGNATAAAAAAAAEKRQLPEELAKRELELDQEQDDTAAGGGGGSGDASPVAATTTNGTSGGGAVASNRGGPLAEVLSYTARHLLRVYPSGLRILDNSNPDPTAAWARGASLAALNWQLADESVAANVAFFSAQGGGSGYVLKPSWMRPGAAGGADAAAAAASEAAAVLGGERARTLAVTLYSAHRAQGRSVGAFKDDLYVELRLMSGVPGDAAAARSRHQRNTGRLVLDQDFELVVKAPELAVLVVLLKDHDTAGTDKTLGLAAIALASLHEGEWLLPLAKPGVLGDATAAARHRRRRNQWVKLKLTWK